VQTLGAVRDNAVQTSATTKLELATATFEGIGRGIGYNDPVTPPDPTGAVGKTALVQWVNQSFAIFDKTSHKVVYPSDGSPADGNTLWYGFGKDGQRGHECATTNDGDPIVVYDRLADRWLFTQFSYSQGHYLQCVAVSRTSDPLGAYARYAYEFTLGFNDYGKFGVWTDGYYASFNMFEGPYNAPFQGSNLCVFEREKMLSGASARMVCFFLKGIGAPLPAHIEGEPPAGSAPEYFVGLGAAELNTWRFKANWARPEQSLLTGATPVSGVEAFQPACDAATCNTVPQGKADEKLDSMGDRLMYRLTYRHFADHESFVVNHAVRVAPDNGKGSQVIAVRWYELRTDGTRLTVHRGGTYRPDSAARWMGSMAMDKRGDILLGYSASEPNAYGSIRATGTNVDAPTSKTPLGQEVVLIKGSAAQSRHNWGDYTTLVLDPSDDCTFWYFAEYLHSGEKDWRTGITSIVFPGCLK
jgi:hypothetical protein